MAHIINHPCEGMDCRECETCKFDAPIPEYEPPEKKATPNSLCNYCGYLIKNYRDHGDVKYNACCGKHLVQSDGVTRPRTISFRIQDPVDIPIPDWCPKLLDSESDKPSIAQLVHTATHQRSLTEVLSTAKTEYERYNEKRKKMENMPKHVEWEDIKEGKLYVIPQLMKQKGKIIRAGRKTEYTLMCNAVDENLQDTSFIHNVYRRDLDAVFIVEYHKF